MYKLKIVIGLLIGSIFVNAPFNNDKQPTKNTLKIRNLKNSEEDKGFTVKDKDYTLSFKIINVASKTPSLLITMELRNGAHYISPFAKGDFTGKFFMDLGRNSHLDFKNEIIESPRSIEVFDSHHLISGSVNWVRVYTTYRQLLQVKTQKDFEVLGKLRFTIEPRCTLEEIPFRIVYTNGKVKIVSPKC